MIQESFGPADEIRFRRAEAAISQIRILQAHATASNAISALTAQAKQCRVSSLGIIKDSVDRSLEMITRARVNVEALHRAAVNAPLLD